MIVVYFLFLLLIIFLVVRKIEGFNPAAISNNKNTETIPPPRKTENNVAKSNTVNNKRDIQLPSEKGLDYSKLCQCLEEEKWEAANDETVDLLYKLIGERNEALRDYRISWSKETVDTIPKIDLNTIDYLWTKYSDGKFGFTTQREILQKSEFDLIEFAKQIGWLVENKWVEDKNSPLSKTGRDFNYSLTAPNGHLPAIKEIHHYGKTDNVLQEMKSAFPPVDKLTPFKSLLYKIMPSSVKIDYSKLRSLLAESSWAKADQETGHILADITGNLSMLGSTPLASLKSESIDDIPKIDIETIDFLWTTYSNNRFGFSVQKRIYFEGIFNVLTRLGWFSESGDSRIDFQNLSLQNEEGHLPAIIWFWSGIRHDNRFSGDSIFFDFIQNEKVPLDTSKISNHAARKPGKYCFFLIERGKKLFDNKKI